MGGGGGGGALPKYVNGQDRYLVRRTDEQDEQDEQEEVTNYMYVVASYGPVLQVPNSLLPCVCCGEGITV